MKTIRRIALVAASVALLGGCVFAFGGCQTRLTAEKFPENPLPIQQVVQIDGTNKVVTTGYYAASGGWYVTARSPLWAKEQIKGLDVGAKSTGDVWLRTDSYDRDLSTNAVHMTREIFVGSKDLVATVAAAYATIAGGGAQADTVASLAARAVKLFVSKGGKVDAAKLTSDGESVTISDGTVGVQCRDGQCSDCPGGNCSDR